MEFATKLATGIRSGASTVHNWTTGWAWSGMKADLRITAAALSTLGVLTALVVWDKNRNSQETQKSDQRHTIKGKFTAIKFQKGEVTPLTEQDGSGTVIGALQKTLSKTFTSTEEGEIKTVVRGWFKNSTKDLTRSVMNKLGTQTLQPTLNLLLGHTSPEGENKALIGLRNFLKPLNTSFLIDEYRFTADEIISSLSKITDPVFQQVLNNAELEAEAATLNKNLTYYAGRSLPEVKALMSEGVITRNYRKLDQLAKYFTSKGIKADWVEKYNNLKEGQALLGVHHSIADTFGKFMTLVSTANDALNPVSE